MKDQIQFQTNGITVLAHKISEYADCFETKNGTVYWYERVPLPEGKWKYHCTTSDMTEEQAKVLVTDFGQYNYRDYTGFLALRTAIESLNTLLRSHGIDPNEKHVLLIKEI